MKALILGTDFLKDSEGNLRILETNTNVDIHNKIVPDLDWVTFKQFLVDNSITNLHFIYTTGNLIPNGDKMNAFDTSVPDVKLTTKLQELMTELSGTFTEYNVPKNSVTVPFIEDGEGTLILRTSFDTTAVVDEEYAKDKVNFHKVISNKPYGNKIYYSSSNEPELNVDQLNELHLTDGQVPNYIVKTRLPHTGYKTYPKLFKIVSLENLQTLKDSLTDSEFMEEYHINSENIVNEKMGVIRSLDIVYGGTLDCLHLGSYVMTAAVKNNEWETTYDTSGLLTQESRVLWMTKSPTHTLMDAAYIMDDDTPIIYDDNSLRYPNQILENDVVKTIFLPWVPVDETSSTGESQFLTNVNSGTFDADLTQFTTGPTAVNHLSSETKESLMIRVTLENGVVYEDLPGSSMMVEEFDTLKTTFVYTNRFRINDSIVFFDYVNNTLIKSKITKLEVVYVNRTIYHIDVETSDLFLPIADSTLGLSFIQHNPPCAGWCNQFYCYYYSCQGCVYCDNTPGKV